jgi:hypothetical protein
MGEFQAFFPRKHDFSAVWRLYRIEFLLRHLPKFIYFVRL